MDLLRIAARVATSWDWSKVQVWANGRDPSEYGWIVDGVEIVGSTLSDDPTLESLQKAGVPESLISAAEAAGYGLNEIDVFLMDNGDKVQKVKKEDDKGFWDY